MRHRASRPFTDLLHRVLRARSGRALLAVIVVLSLGTAAYAALGSTTGGSPDQAASAGATPSRDDALDNPSRDVERPTPTPVPTLTAPTRSASSSASSAPTKQPTRHHATPSASPSASASSEARTPTDTTAPDTTLSADDPSGTAATFSFSADEPASFTCSLDGAAYTACGSPVSYSDLAAGWHTFAVRATDEAGNTDPSPAATRWHADGSSTGE